MPSSPSNSISHPHTDSDSHSHPPSNMYTLSPPQPIEVDTIVSSSSTTASGEGKKVKIIYQLYTPTDPLKADSKNRPPVLLIRGYQGVRQAWGLIAEALAPERSVLIYDNRGMGDSDVPPSGVNYTMKEFCNDAISLINKVYGPTSLFHMVGISMGGMIAQHLLVTYTDRIISCVLGCTYASSKTCERNPVLVKLQSQQSLSPTTESNDWMKQQESPFLEYFLTPTFLADPANNEIIEELKSNFYRYNRSLKGARGQGAAIATHDLESQLKHITIPTLIQHGTADSTVMFSNAIRLKELLSDSSKLSVYENAGHGYWLIDWKEGVNCRMVREVNEWMTEHEKNRNNTTLGATAA